MAQLEPILEKLRRAHHTLLHVADSVPADQWNATPEQGGWSAAELVAHLIMVERSVISKADGLLQKTPKHIPFLKRFHLPLALVEARLIRRKSPIPLDPELVREKEEMLAELRRVRERTLAFVEETKTRDMGVYWWPHPFIGSLNTYGWFELIACHESRHAKQLREICTGLPKAILSLQK
jgi:DinB superfamily